ncbi:hypothetical protein LCGC14_1437360 [marine sediment metagenome]|uniref:Uncharacterized protein n=1 Tax=marine sediment metagenome TaxID=412755 RepID=A0A0F9JLW3_9ZZZZ
MNVWLAFFAGAFVGFWFGLLSIAILQMIREKKGKSHEKRTKNKGLHKQQNYYGN